MLDHVQPVAPPLEVMALFSHHFALGPAVLLGENRLLPANPAQSRDHGEPDGLVVEAQGNRHSNLTLWRIHRQVKILDVFTAQPLPECLRPRSRTDQQSRRFFTNAKI